MNVYQKVSTVVAICLYIPLARQILSRQVKQNLATWLLWAVLDALAAASMFAQDGNWFLPAAYVAGCTLIVICLIIVKTSEWTWFETVISAMVIVCLIGWKMSGPWIATVLSTIGVVLAGLPQIKDAYKTPAEMPLVIYVGYTVVNIIATIGGSDWSVEQRLYPASCVVLCAIVVVVSCKKFFQTEIEPRIT